MDREQASVRCALVAIADLALCARHLAADVQQNDLIKTLDLLLCQVAGTIGEPENSRSEPRAFLSGP